MKNINAKMTALLFSFVSMAYASDGDQYYDSDDEDTYHLPRRETAVAAPVTSRVPIEQEGFNASSFSRLTWPVLAHLGSYLTVEDQLVLARMNHQQAYGLSVNAGRIYAECIFQNTPVPQEIKNILYRVTNVESQQEISKDIAECISNKRTILHQRKSLPPFLQNYFYQITSRDLHRVLNQNISNQSILSQALLHMETGGTYWVHSEQTSAMDSFILKYAELSYISFQNALQLPADRAIPKYITATENEVRDYNNMRPLNSFFARNPNAVLVIDAQRSTTLANFSCFPKIKHIAFIGSHITHIGHNFLYDCSDLESVTLPNTITHIGRWFLSRCYRLTTLDLSSLSNVTSIGDDFLAHCCRLTTLDLPSLSNVTSIGNKFLYHCRRLATLDLSSLSNVTSIGDEFLSWCDFLTMLDLSPLSNVTSIGDSFLSECRGLTTLDLSPLSNVTSIGDRFLSHCFSLTTLDLSPLSNLTSITRFFLCKCTGLITLDLSGLSKVTSIGTKFLYDCDSLTKLDLSALSEITFIGANFLADCDSLTTLDLSPLSKVTFIKPGFLSDCDNLQEIFVKNHTLRRYPHLRAIIGVRIRKIL